MNNNFQQCEYKTDKNLYIYSTQFNILCVRESVLFFGFRCIFGFINFCTFVPIKLYSFEKIPAYKAKLGKLRSFFSVATFRQSIQVLCTQCYINLIPCLLKSFSSNSMILIFLLMSSISARAQSKPLSKNIIV